VLSAVLMSMNCGTCTCNKHKMPGFLSACQFNSPLASIYIWCLANYGRQQTLPCIIKKRIAHDIYIYSITFYFKWNNACISPQSCQQKTGNIFGHIKWLYARNLQHSVSRNEKYSLVSAMCWLSNYYIHMSTNDFVVGYTPIWNISSYTVNTFIYLLKSIKKWIQETEKAPWNWLYMKQSLWNILIYRNWPYLTIQSVLWVVVTEWSWADVHNTQEKLDEFA